MRNRRGFGPSEARVLGPVALVLLLWASAAVKWPQSIAWPFAVIVGWWGLSLFTRAVRLYVEGRDRLKDGPSAHAGNPAPPGEKPNNS
jgi:hypothetical protein